MILEEQPRRGGPWPSQCVPDSQLFAQPFTEYQVAIVGCDACSPLSRSQVYGSFVVVCFDLRLNTCKSIVHDVYQVRRAHKDFKRWIRKTRTDQTPAWCSIVPLLPHFLTSTSTSTSKWTREWTTVPENPQARRVGGRSRCGSLLLLLFVFVHWWQSTFKSMDEGEGGGGTGGFDLADRLFSEDQDQGRQR